MSTENELGALSGGPRFLTDDQIIDLYRKASARRLEVRNETLLRDRDRMLFAGFWDFVLYSFLVVSLDFGSTPAWVGLGIILFLARFIPIGPFSIVYWMNHRYVKEDLEEADSFGTKRRHSNKERLKNLYWLNRHGEPAVEEKINPYSISVKRTVAESLTEPLLISASLAEDKLAAQREGVEALLSETERLCEEIRANRLQAGDLEEVFDTRLSEARETVKTLKGELQRIEKAMWNIRTELAPLRAYLKKLGELEQATKKLATIRNQMATVLGVPADPLEQLEFQRLPQRLEQARENLREIGVSLKAYEDAVAEVQELEQNN